MTSTRTWARRLRSGPGWRVEAAYRSSGHDRLILVGRSVVLVTRLPHRHVDVTSKDVRTASGMLDVAEQMRQESWDLAGRLSDLSGVYMPVRNLLTLPRFGRVLIGEPPIGFWVSKPGDTREWLARVPRDLPTQAVEQAAVYVRSVVGTITDPLAVRQSEVRTDTF